MNFPYVSSDCSNYQLDHLIAKDDSGAVFRAFDIGRGEQVAFRKFFPFGAAGGGLSKEAQAVFNAAIETLKEVRHPNLRSILDGGLDADGMPYMVAEWIDGTSVQSFAERGKIDPGDFVNLIGKVLEVSELLSVALGKHGVWIETNLHMIGVGGPASGREVTFWITPMKWEGSNAAGSGLGCLVSLIEDVMTWGGSAIPGHACKGLGGWLMWLRGVSTTTTLREARIHLKESIRSEPVPERKTFLPMATRAPRPIQVNRPVGVNRSTSLNYARQVPPVRIVVMKNQSGLSPFASGLVALALLALASWGLIIWNNSRMPVPGGVVVTLKDLTPK
ncbi:MAG: hypothetical protein ABIT37_05285 [Luteolibacter sp.]